MSKESFLSSPYLFLIPAAIFMVAFIVYPFLYSVYNGFFSWNWAHPEKGIVYVGLDNYVSLLLNSDFQNSLRVTFLYTALVLSIEFPLGLILAVLLAQNFKGVSLLRTVCLIPLMTSRVAAALIWQLIYHETIGPLNYLISLLGGKSISWLSNPHMALFSCCLVTVWLYVPFEALILMAAILSIPSDIIESAKVDGASSITIFRHITLPLIKPTAIVVLLIRTMDTLRVFDEVYILTSGGPAGATEVVSFYAYRSLFSYLDVGYASAICVFTLVLLTIVSIPYIKMTVGGLSAR